MDNLNELWWRRVPASARRLWAFLSATLLDGAYLSSVPRVGAIAPPAAMAFGAALSIWRPSDLTYWSMSLLALAALVVVASLGAAIGLAVWLGYGLADVVLYSDSARNRSGVAIGTAVLGVLLVVAPVVTGNLRRELRRYVVAGTPRAVADVVMHAVFMGGIAFAWVKTAPQLIRPVFEPNYTVPQFEPLQFRGHLIVLTVVVCAAARMAVERFVWPRAAEAEAAAIEAVRAAPPPAFLLPIPVTIVARSALITVALEGMMANWAQRGVTFVALCLAFGARYLLGGGTRWARVVNAIPMAGRLVLIVVLTHQVTKFVFDDPLKDSFVPLITVLLIGIGITAVLMPVRRSAP